MKQCEECTKRIDLYLDGELSGEELDVFEYHVKNCTSCLGRLSSQRLYLERLRLSRPLYTAPLALRERVERLLEEEPAAYRKVPVDLRQGPAGRVKECLRSFVVLLWLKPIPAFATITLATVGLLALWTFSQQEARATAFVDLAVNTHKQQLSGRIPIELTTGSPAKMAGWFTDKVPFPFRLPAYQEQPGQTPPYKLVGGRLITFRADYAAYVAYEMNKNLISLIIASGPSSLAYGGETTTTRGLTFHSHQHNGLQVVTWSAHNLAYALVSSINVPARRSCAVCHASPRDNELLRNIH